jgi:hypothetical protein
MIKMKETRMTKVGTIETCAPEGLFFFLNRNLKSSQGRDLFKNVRCVQFWFLSHFLL